MKSSFARCVQKPVDKTFLVCLSAGTDGGKIDIGYECIEFCYKASAQNKDGDDSNVKNNYNTNDSENVLIFNVF
jgi:hypothetical protein